MGKYVFLLILVLITVLSLLYQNKLQKRIETFQSTSDNLAKRFRIRIGVWSEPHYTNETQFVDYLATLLPIDRVDYKDKFTMFYDLREKFIDMVFASERDYMIYWSNYSKPGESILDIFRKKNEIQFLCSLYHNYYYLIVDYYKIANPNSLEGKVIKISPEEHLGTEFEEEILSTFNPHIMNRKGDLVQDGFQRLTKDIDGMLYLNNYPDKLLLEHSNKKEIYLMNLREFPKAEECFKKYLYLNKRTIDLRLYPYILQRWNSRNRTGSLLVDGSSKLDVFATKMVLFANSDLNVDWVFDFLRVIYGSLDTIRTKLSFADNFYNRDTAMSRLCMNADVLQVHEGAREFFRRIGFYSLNQDEGCKYLNRECTDDQVARYGDYIRN